MSPDGLKFILSEPDQIDDGNGDWGSTIFADKNVFLASYATQADAIRSRTAMAKALQHAIFIATSES